MTDTQMKHLAEIVLTQDKMIDALLTAYRYLHECVVPSLPPDDLTLKTAHHFEQLEAMAADYPDALKQSRAYFGLPPAES